MQIQIRNPTVGAAEIHNAENIMFQRPCPARRHREDLKEIQVGGNVNEDPSALSTENLYTMLAALNNR